MTTSPDVIDYEGSGYRTDFWEGKGRDYEDQTERVAIRRLLPPTGKRLLELGAGFGRLTREYDGYEQVILLDYSTTLLREAQQQLGRDDHFVYAAANIYQLPINEGVCDAATMIRVIHHFADVPAALQQIRSTLAPGGVFILEFANKRNLKAVARYLLRRQDWNPFDREPVEFVKLNFDFHPAYMLDTLKDAGFTPEKQLSLSYLRLGVLKRVVPTGILVGIDSLLQHTASLGTYSPSVFTRNIATGNEPPALLDGPIFKCPACGEASLNEETDRMACQNCGKQWAIEDGIYNFKEPL
ncbi:MAG: class I SAM-dependent methyltransferase [Chloroflexi bacterium]|nr:class I SAM-dependent methyltransferase [Chloroflexota bacterium]